MRRVTLKLRKLLVEEDGPTTTEYAVMVGLIVAIALMAIILLGQNVNTAFASVSDSVASSEGGGHLSGGPQSSQPFVHLHLLEKQ